MSLLAVYLRLVGFWCQSNAQPTEGLRKIEVWNQPGANLMRRKPTMPGLRWSTFSTGVAVVRMHSPTVVQLTSQNVIVSALVYPSPL